MVTDWISSARADAYFATIRYRRFWRVLLADSFHAYWEVIMHTVNTEILIERASKDRVFDEAQLAAAAFLARYSAQTLDAYRHDLRSFFNSAGTSGLAVGGERSISPAQ